MSSSSADYTYAFWGFVAFNLVFVLAFGLSYLVPRRQFEWRSLSVLVAWGAALFFQMYGFPLTIYLLSNLLGRVFPVAEPFLQLNGHLLRMVVGDSPMVALVVYVATSLMFFRALVLMGRAFSQIHTAKGKLVTDGLYAYVRHPQYSALLLLIVSLFIQWPTLLSWLMAPILLVTYLRLAQREEREMTGKFGEAYLVYHAQTPAFVPSLNSLTRRKTKAV